MGPADEVESKPFSYTNSKGVTYYLNKKEVTLRGGKKMDIRYFTKDLRPETVEYYLPSDMVINENPRNGFLTVRRVEEEKPKAHVIEDFECCDDCCWDDEDDGDYPVKKEQPDEYTERRCIVEEIKSTVEVDSEDSNQPEDYNYQVDTVRYYYAKPDELSDTRVFSLKPTSAEIVTEKNFTQYGKNYTKYQLEAHIKNLLTILNALD